MGTRFFNSTCINCGREYRGAGAKFCSLSCNYEYKTGKKRSDYSAQSTPPKTSVVSAPQVSDIDTESIGKTVWEYVDKKVKKDVSLKDFFKLALAKQKLHEDLSTSQDVGRVNFKTPNQYIAIMFSADWHFGGCSVDYQQLEAYLDLVLNTPNLYLITVGDLIDNFVNFKNVMPILSQLWSPKEQAEWLSLVIQQYKEKGKWIASCWGNHDIERDEKILGSSTIKQRLGENFIYFNNKGILMLNVNDIKYSILLSHKFAGHSMYNPNHSQGRAYREDFPADVVVSAHIHQAAYQKNYRYMPARELGMEFGGECHYVQVGTFNTNDGHSKRYYGKGHLKQPILLFNSIEKEILYFDSPEIAVRNLNFKPGKKKFGKIA